MGEYAKRLSDGAEIKIGTCEDMYYIRFESRHMVRPICGQTSQAISLKIGVSCWGVTLRNLSPHSLYPLTLQRVQREGW